VFRKLLTEQGMERNIDVDSAGTHAYHIDEPPDQRAVQAAAYREIDLTHIRGRQATRKDFNYFDYLLAMDEENRRDLLHIAPSDLAHKVRLFMEFSNGFNEREVPDPYWGGVSGFDRVLDMIEDAARGLLEDIRVRHQI
jgi:protein-tyrosine phosphatase